METKILSQGAEAIIYQKDNWVVKDRISKTYRLHILDKSLRKRRTKSEKKLLEKASKIILAPKPLESKEKTTIIMPFIKGEKISENLEKLSEKEQKQICKKIGESTAKLHNSGIIHGDLTTSNTILDTKNNVWLIDFGLGFHSNKIEDKAVDLHLINQAFEAKHFQNFKSHWKSFLKGYKKSKDYSKILERLKKVESRGRYKEKH
jgi:Kae1-associated kinase Bud32